MVGRHANFFFLVVLLPSSQYYFMTTACILITICKEIEKLARMFLQGSTSLGLRSSLVNWNDGCMPMVNVELGIRKIQDQNKLFFSLQIGIQLIWLLIKIVCGFGSWGTIIMSSNCSYVWHSISNVKKCIIWSIGDGRLVNFWNNVWVRSTWWIPSFLWRINNVQRLLTSQNHCEPYDPRATWFLTILQKRLVID